MYDTFSSKNGLQKIQSEWNETFSLTWNIENDFLNLWVLLYRLSL